MKRYLLILAFLFLPIFGWWFFIDEGGKSAWQEHTRGSTVLQAGRDFRIEDDGKRLAAIPDSDMLTTFERLKPGFESLDFSLAARTAFAASTVTKRVKVHQDAPDKKSKRGIGQDGDTLTAAYEVDRDIVVKTDYHESKEKRLDGFSPVKQTITITNHHQNDRVMDFSTRVVISADAVVWDNQEYPITDKPQSFKAYDKTVTIPELAAESGQSENADIESFKNYTHTYRTGSSIMFNVDGHPALYDWADALAFDPEIRVYRESGQSILEFLITDITVAGRGEVVIDPAFGLNDILAYDIRYDGSAEILSLTSQCAMQFGDVNGDGDTDFLIGNSTTWYQGTNSGSLFVVFGGAGITTGDQPLDVASNYNIRYDGGAAYVALTNAFNGDFGNFRIGDVNGDSLSDLVIGSSSASSNNVQNSGSVWVMFSTLIDDVGATTGNVKPLSVASNYNIRYDGGAERDSLTAYGALRIGDVNGDALPDLVVGAYGADNNGFNSGSVYVVFSTLVDDVGATTGNNQPLSTATNYNIRYDGAAEKDTLTFSSALQIGDVNGDSLSDLVVGTSEADNNGASSGSFWVIFSTLIDDVGATTGNNQPLSMSTNYNIRYDGGAATDYLGGVSGMTCLRIGDVNGDSFSDLVVGTGDADNNGASSGSVWVMFSTLIDDVGATTGNNQPLSTATNYNIRYDGGAVSDALTAGSALQIGDVNGDAFPDLVVGATGADNNGGVSGSVWVMFSTLIDDVGATTGNNKPLSTGTNYNIRYDGSVASDAMPSNGALRIGDVNGDSLSDLVLGTNSADYNGSNSGSVWIMFSTLIDDVGATTGNNKPLSTATNYNIRYDGIAAFKYLLNFSGLAALQIGDVNGDALPDLVLGASGADNNGPGSGSVWVMFSTLIDDVGATTGNTKLIATASNYSIRYDGSVMSSNMTSTLQTGDVNGDGSSDLVLATASTSYSGSLAGAVFVVFGGTDITIGDRPLDIAGNYNIRYDGAAANDSLGGTVQIGDVNGDSLSDLVLGASFADNNGSNSGSAWVIFSTLVDDVGATTGNNKPLSTATNYNIRYDGGAVDDVLKVHRIGDVNGDSLPDLVLGTSSADNNGSSSGSAWVIFSTLVDDVGTTTGNNQPLSTATNYNIRYDGGAANDFMTSGTYDYACQIGDVNGDALPDLVLGASDADNNGSSSGSAYVMFSTLIDDVGATTGNNKPLSTAGNYNIRYNGGAANDRITGGGNLRIGDVNGDSLPDLVLGSTAASNNGAGSGSVWVMFSTLIDDVGATTGNSKSLSTATNYNIRYDGGAATDALTSFNALQVGDVNGDSLSDLVLGTAGADNNGVSSGAAWVMFSTLIDDVGATTGNNKPLSTATNYNIRYDGGAAADNLTGGNNMQIGDVDGDSLLDLVMGASGADNNGSSSGAIYVIFSTLIDDVGATTGNNQPLSTTANYSIRYDGANPGDSMGGNTWIGDMDDDGVSDLVFSATAASSFRGSLAGSIYAIFGGSDIIAIPDNYIRGAISIQGSAFLQ